jgi:hypothetical protein
VLGQDPASLIKRHNFRISCVYRFITCERILMTLMTLMTDMMNFRDPSVLHLERLSDPNLGAARMETFGKS